jgi:hypothetical protein
MRLAVSLAVVALAGAVGNAPLQCSRRSDPELRGEDSAGDALWNLAQDFEKKGNHSAAQETLRFLVEHYPSNRHAPFAREQLEGTSGDRDGG